MRLGEEFAIENQCKRAEGAFKIAVTRKLPDTIFTFSSELDIALSRVYQFRTGFHCATTNFPAMSKMSGAMKQG